MVPFARAASVRRRQSSSERAIGFCSWTAKPASMIGSATSAWNGVGTSTSTTSGAHASTSAVAVPSEAPGRFGRHRVRRSGSRSHAATISTSSRARYAGSTSSAICPRPTTPTRIGRVGATGGLLDRVVVGFAQTARHARQQLARDARDLVEDAAELALAEHHELHRRLRGDGRVARRLVEEGQLAERRARAERRDLAAAAAHLGGTAQDHEELRAGGTLAHEDPPGFDLHVLGPAGDEREL